MWKSLKEKLPAALESVLFTDNGKTHYIGFLCMDRKTIRETNTLNMLNNMRFWMRFPRVPVRMLAVTRRQCNSLEECKTISECQKTGCKGVLE